MMKTSWKCGLHVHNYMSTGQCAPVGQRNPLRQEMWVSNPLEGYRMPVSAVRCLSALSKTLMGPRAKACQATRQRDGEPHTMVHWTLALTHALPLRLHTQGPYHRCNTTQMYTTAHGLAEVFGSTHTFNADEDIFCLSLGLWLLPFLQENSLKSPNLDTQSPKTGHF